MRSLYGKIRGIDRVRCRFRQRRASPNTPPGTGGAPTLQDLACRIRAVGREKASWAGVISAAAAGIGVGAALPDHAVRRCRHLALGTASTYIRDLEEAGPWHIPT